MVVSPWLPHANSWAQKDSQQIKCTRNADACADVRHDTYDKTTCNVTSKHSKSSFASFARFYLGLRRLNRLKVAMHSAIQLPSTQTHHENQTHNSLSHPHSDQALARRASTFTSADNGVGNAQRKQGMRPHTQC